MRVMTRDEEEILDDLKRLAGGDLQLLEQAFRAAAQDGEPASLKDIVRYIVKHRDDAARAA